MKNTKEQLGLFLNQLGAWLLIMLPVLLIALVWHNEEFLWKLLWSDLILLVGITVIYGLCCYEWKEKE
jgi:hypothetical protein